MNSYYLEKNLWGRLLSEREFNQVFTHEDKAIKDVIQAKTIKINAVDQKAGLQCRRCNNQNKNKFSVLPGKVKPAYYCLNCIQMGRLTTQDLLYYIPDPTNLKETIESSCLTWEGTLSPQQEKASHELVRSLSDVKVAHLVYAVTGAGKTEIIFPAIDRMISLGGRVAIASPRIDVCLELAPRLQAAFQHNKVALLYGDSDEDYVYTEIVVSTTHQLLRFQAAFDLVIVDEVDAFPYADDRSLHYAVKRAVKNETGKLIYLTATPNQKIKQELKEGKLVQTILPARYHRHPLPEPTFKWLGDWRTAINKRHSYSKLWQVLMSFLNISGVKLIFIPSIDLAEKLHAWLETTAPQFNLASVHSKDPERKEKVQALRDNLLDGLISTTILERGVTFTNCHVFIVGAEDKLFSSSALVQMSGRVGRKEAYPTGELIYGHHGKSRNMIQARKEIKDMNRLASEKGLVDY